MIDVTSAPEYGYIHADQWIDAMVTLWGHSM